MEKAYEAVAYALVEQGYVVDLLTTWGYHDALRTTSPYDQIATAPKYGRAGRYSLMWWAYTMWWSFRYSGAYDLIFGISSSALSLSLASNRVPLIVQSHGTALTEARSILRSISLRQLPRLLLNVLRIPRDILAYRRSDIVIAISENVFGDLLAWPYRINSENIQLIHNGIDAEMYRFNSEMRRAFRSANGFQPEEIVGLFVGRVDLQKGVDILVHSLALDAARSRLLVCGNGPAVDHVREIARVLNVSDRLTLAGHLDGGELRAAMCGADVGLLPSRRTEGLPLSLLEMLAAGLPVIASSSASVPSELACSVRTADSAHEIGDRWADPAPNSNRASRLPDKFTSRCSLERYLSVVSTTVTGDQP